MANLMKRFDNIIEEGVKYADTIRCKNLYEFQCLMINFLKEKEIQDIAVSILEKNPEKKLEIQRKIMAVTAEGRRVEDSLLR